MKRIVIIIAVVLGLASSVVAQTKDNVARECVLFELFTGVNCPYCPAAANAVAQFLDEGKPIAPVAYHTNSFSTPLYYTTETNARASFYGVTSYPTLKTDGVYSMSGGGSASQNNYSYYIGYYNNRINQTSPFTIDLTCEPLPDGTCMAHCTVTQVGDCSATNLKVMIALTQCNINVSWQGMTGLHHVCRDLIPTQNGTTFVGPSVSIDEPFNLNWPKEDCYLTAWIQTFSGNKEVFQAVRLPLAMNLDYDLAMKNVEEYSPTNCSGTISPIVTVKNVGMQDISSFDIIALVDGTEKYRETWTGTLPSGEMVEHQMGLANIGDCEQVTFMVVEPDGHEDGFAADNKLVVSFDETPTIDGALVMQLKTDQHPEETTVKIQDMATGEVVNEFTFDQPGHAYVQDIVLMKATCYRITVYDSAGDGFGAGAVLRFTDGEGHLLFKGGATYPFKNEYSFELYCDGTISTSETVVPEPVVYPNPSHETVYVTLGEGEWQLEVYDMSGRLVLRNERFTNGPLELEGCSDGVYLLKADNGKEKVISKIMRY